MTPTDPGGPADRPEDRRSLEQAGLDYWREVARQRRVEAARVQRRPLVRVAVAVDRRTRGGQDALARAAGHMRTTSRRLSVRVAGWRHLPERARRRVELADHLGGAPCTTDDRPVLVVHLGPVPAVGTGREVVCIDARDGGDRLSPSAVDAINAAVCTAAAPLVVLLGPGSQPAGEGWLDHLTGPIAGDVVATAPLAVHPERTWTDASPHDLRVRAAGLDLVRDSAGVPRPRSHDAGARPSDVVPGPTTSATGAGLAVDRDAWLAVGGLRPLPGGDADATIIDLCLRLTRAGGTMEVVASATLLDRRPVRRRSDLTTPVDEDSVAWPDIVDTHGSALVALAGGSRDAREPATITLTTSTPSRKLASRSGDWLYAGLFADALRRGGHRVRVQTAEEADSPAGRVGDVHIVLRGLEPVRRTAGQAHVLWVISHPEALDAAECDEADLVLVASERGAARLRRLTTTPVEVLLQATEPRFFRPRPVEARHRHPLTVVASSRGVRRPAVTDAIAAGLTPAVYGQGWQGVIEPGLWVADYAEAHELPVVYSSAGVVLNDHWATMRHEGYVSNRIFDVLACGTPVVSDHLPEVTDLFGDLVPTWRSPEELAAVVAALRAEPEATASRTAEARALVLGAHTLDHRVARLAHLLDRHGLGPPAPEER